MFEVSLTNEQKVAVTLAPVTQKGKPVEVENIEFSVVSGNCTVEQDLEDPKKATIISSDDPGSSEVLVEADADLGEGVETISDVIKVVVAGARAANLGLTIGTPELK